MRYFRYHNCNLECPYFQAKHVIAVNTMSVNGIDVETKFNLLDHDIDDIQTDISGINGEIDTIQSDLTSLDNRLDTAETNISNLQSGEISLDNRIDTLEGKTVYQAASTGLTSFTSDMNVGSGILVVKNTGANVGVNVASPAYDLDVLGDVNTASVYKVGGTTVLGSSGLGSGVLASSLTSVGTLSSLAVSGDFSVDSPTVYVNSTTNRLGVGTVNPSTAIHAVGSITTDANLLATGYVKGAFVGARVRKTTSTSFSASTSMFAGVNAVYNQQAVTGSGYSSTTGGFTPRFTGFYRVTMTVRADDGTGNKGFIPAIYNIITETYSNILTGDGVVWLPIDSYTPPRRMTTYTITANFTSNQTIFMLAYAPTTATYTYFEMSVDFLGV